MVTHRLLLYVFVIVFKGLESQKLETITPNGLESGIVGFNVHLEWNVDVNINEEDYSILKVENELTKTLENTRKYTQRLDDTRIVLTINNVTLDDAGIYRCKLFATGEYKDIYLKVGDPKIYSYGPIVTDYWIKLQWLYEYGYHARAIIFIRQLHDEPFNVGFWMDGSFRPTLVGGQDRLKFDKRDLQGGADITLTLLNPTEDDFRYNYTCRCYFIDRTTAVAASVAITISEEPNGTNVVRMPFVVAVTTVVVLVVIMGVVLVHELRRSQSYSTVKNTETEELRRSQSYSTVKNTETEDGISIGSTSTTSEQTLTRKQRNG